MKTTLMTFGLVLILLCCVLANTTSAQDSPDFDSEYNRFSFDLHRTMTQDHENENLVCSPWGVACVLGMLYAGASDEAAAEIDAVFDFSKMSQTQTDFLMDIPKSFQTGRPSEHNGELIAANSCWLHRDFDVLPEYKSDITKQYRAAIETLDFNNPRQTVKRINQWCAEKTKNLIPSIVTPEDFDPALQQQLVLLNTVYFSGKWLFPFSKQATEKAPFHLADGNTMQTNMMAKSYLFDYHAGKNYEAVRLPYRNNASMIVILPNENRTLAEMEAKLDGAALELICKNLKLRKGTVKIPRFEFISGDSLIATLQQLGINDIFSGEKQPLSKINVKGPLYVTIMRQMAMIKVDEEGTIAAAATMGGGGYGGGDPRMPFEFTADRPFLFVIRENTTGAVLFIGRVHKPEKARP